MCLRKTVFSIYNLHIHYYFILNIEPRLQLQTNLKQIKKNLELINSYGKQQKIQEWGLVSGRINTECQSIPFSLTGLPDSFCPSLRSPPETNHFFMLQRIPSLSYILFLLCWHYQAWYPFSAFVSPSPNTLFYTFKVYQLSISISCKYIIKRDSENKSLNSKEKVLHQQDSELGSYGPSVSHGSIKKYPRSWLKSPYRSFWKIINVL